MSLNARRIQRTTGLAAVRVYARLGSTQCRAARLVEDGALALPAAVVASRQSAGHGRGCNLWHADGGSLTVTLALPIQTGRAVQELPLRAGLATRAALARWIAPARLTIKWPNDVLADGRKIAGVLCERVRGADLVGIGVNVSTDLSRAPAAVRARATTMAQALARSPGPGAKRRTPAPPQRDEVLCELTSALLRSWEEVDWCAAVNRVHALAGRQVTIDCDGQVVRGRCEEIDGQGALVLRVGGQRRAILSGTVVEWSEAV